MFYKIDGRNIKIDGRNIKIDGRNLRIHNKLECMLLASNSSLV